MDYHSQIAEAIRRFWLVRGQQQTSQGATSGKRDAGNRSAVTAGKHLDGFIELLREILTAAGLPDAAIHTRSTTLPGYFRPTKNWDLVAVLEGALIASVEFKAHIGPSFGNNYNNRVEEALGSAVDVLTAYREGQFRPGHRPWLGWLMLLEDSARSASPVRIDEPHFDVFPEFRQASYAKRYEIFCERLLRERWYDGACLILSDQARGLEGGFSEPNPDLTFRVFATSLSAHASAFARLRDG